MEENAPINSQEIPQEVIRSHDVLPPTKPHHRNTKWLIILFVIVFLLALLTVSIIYLFNKASFYYQNRLKGCVVWTPSQIPSPITGTTNVISDWQTYRNEKHGFEFKYPIDWQEHSLSSELPNDFAFTSPNTQYKGAVLENGNRVWLSILNISPNQPLLKIIENEQYLSQEVMEPIQGRNVYKLINNNDQVSTSYYIQASESKFIKFLLETGKSEDTQSSNKILDEIILSFKFRTDLSINSWQTYKDTTSNFEVKYPQYWIKEPVIKSGSSITQDFKDQLNHYSFSITILGNYNQLTRKPFVNIDEFINMPYQVKSLMVDGQDARQPLPRAGGENINQVNFFSKDLKTIYSLFFQTGTSALTVSEEEIKEGEVIFNQILSTFKFLK